VSDRSNKCTDVAWTPIVTILLTYAGLLKTSKGVEGIVPSVISTFQLLVSYNLIGESAKLARCKLKIVVHNLDTYRSNLV
jgi:hypothetical protein